MSHSNKESPAFRRGESSTLSTSVTAAASHQGQSSNGRATSGRDISFFIVDTCVSRCYKPQKDKLFGGESPNELPSAVRE